MRYYIAGLLMLLCGYMYAQQVNISIDATAQGREISPMLYGIFFEDINHAADGGLYAELIRNRSFEDDDAQPAYWSGEGGTGLMFTKASLLNDAQRHALVVTFPKQGGGIVNEGFWGINAVEGDTYRLSFFAKGKLKGTLTAMLVSQGGEVLASQTISGKITGKWKKFTADMLCKGNDPHARFVLRSNGFGIIAIDVVSLFPPTFKGRENGCRRDLAQLLADLHPRFMRFPGGCFVEGQDTPDNAFRWHRTVGPIETRVGHENKNWGYRTSDGLGFHEYLQLAEDLGATPLYVTNVGIWHGGFTPVEELQPWIDECLAALEYANGDIHTKYGAMRAANGHPEPFGIHYIEIGNENNQPSPPELSDRYGERFKLFKKAILDKYPDMHIIGDVDAWGTDSPVWTIDEPVELVDEHYYRTPGWFADNFRKYDSYDRTKPAVYVGEYAVTQGFGTTGSINAALGEAIYMMGMENNSDIVRMASYAPIFVNENDQKWKPDMIRFNSAQSFGTPSYHVQKLMSHNVGTRSLPVEGAYTPIADRQGPLKPEVCQVGVGTYTTQATFEKGTLTYNGVTLTQDMNGMEHLAGTWQPEGGGLRQISDATGAMAIGAVKMKSDGYTYRVRARKDSGNEGLIIVFNYADKDNYCWMNLGGWGNSQFAIEQTVSGGRAPSYTTPGRIETGRWYDVRLEVLGDSVSCWLDDTLVVASRLKPTSHSGLYCSASKDDKTGDLILKVVNTGDKPMDINADIKGADPRDFEIIRLMSDSGDSENSMDNPYNVVPTTDTFSTTRSVSQMNPFIVSPPHSLVIVRCR